MEGGGAVSEAAAVSETVLATSASTASRRGAVSEAAAVSETVLATTASTASNAVSETATHDTGSL